MARNTDSGADLKSKQLNKTEINEHVTMDETGTFFMNPLDDSGEVSLSMSDLNFMVSKHKELINRYDKLMKYYRGNHENIINQAPKANGKPDNRIIINYPKQLVKAYVGYFAGVNPSFTIVSNDEKTDTETDILNDGLNNFNTLNNINHFYVQQAKFVDIFGRSLSLVYQDELGNTRLSAVDPRNGFIVYSDDVAAKPVFGVRYRKTNYLTGVTVVDVYAYVDKYDDGNVVSINQHAYSVNITAPDSSQFVDFENDKILYGRLPMVEFIADDEKMGLYEDITTVFDAIDSAVSEKKNDVDYFGDVILFINNMLVNEAGLKDLRDLRILASKSVDGGTTNQGASFLDKPSADGTQENLINRLVTSVYDVSGVVNLNDKDFTNAASGQALKQRLQGMKQIADTKASMFERSFKAIYECFFTGMKCPEATKDLQIKFKRNEPLDILDISQSLVYINTAVASGLISHKTALDNIPIIENSTKELDQIAEERKNNSETMEDIQVPTQQAQQAKTNTDKE